MARKVKTEQNKKRHSKKVILIIFLVLVIVGLGGFAIWKLVFNSSDGKQPVVPKILDNQEEYGYTLSDNDSAFFKKEYEELKKVIKSDPVDDKAYATEVARMFVIDLYTLSTKTNMYDVGGAEFYFQDKKAMFEQKVIDTLYSTMLDNTFGDRKQELPEVNSLETVSVEETTYKLNDNVVNGYLVKMNIGYVKDLKYDTKASVVVCKEDGIRWSVVDIQPTLSPKYN